MDEVVEMGFDGNGGIFKRKIWIGRGFECVGKFSWVS